MHDLIYVGAGPAGLVAALGAAQAGLDVLVLESEPEIPVNLRGSTFHPSTLDKLQAGFGAADDLIARGLVAPTIQYRRHGQGPIAAFDFGDIADLTQHPFRVQAEQYKLCQALFARLSNLPNAEVRFETEVTGIEAGARSVLVRARSRSSQVEPLEAGFVIGADGANSVVRRAVGFEFEGFTWPERFLVVSTPFDFRQPFPDLSSVTYVADPTEWYFLLQIPELWRVMFPIRAEESDEAALAPEAVQRRLARVCPDGSPYEIRHTTLYRVHQRVATSYRAGRVLLSGDAAHVNNPLGGMGMNGGIHDSFELTRQLLRVVGGEAGEEALDEYSAVRRGVALDYVQRVSIQNKRDLEAGELADQRRFEARLREAQDDAGKRREQLQRLAMLSTPAVS